MYFHHLLQKSELSWINLADLAFPKGNVSYFTEIVFLFMQKSHYKSQKTNLDILLTHDNSK